MKAVNKSPSTKVTISPKHLKVMVSKFEAAILKRDFTEIAKLNQLVEQILPNIDQHDADLLPIVVKLRQEHEKCRALVETEQAALRQRLTHNMCLRNRDKAYTKTQVRVEE